MVVDYYGLREQPFGVTPDPHYLYLTPTHREALASLAYGVQSGRGFMSIIAQPGMGKTTILYELLSQLRASARTVFLFQTLCTPRDLLRGLLRDLGVTDCGDDVVDMHARLNDLLLAEARQGRRTILVIDEAQNLEDSALELVRMLSNFETTSHKLMQIVLGGQTQLEEKLASPHLLQLRQRISMFARLTPLSGGQTETYISHRLRVAGLRSKTPLFTPGALAMIAKYSQGVPRNINNICFNALSLGWVRKQKTIGEDVIRESVNDLGIKSEDTGAFKRQSVSRAGAAADQAHNRTAPRARVWPRTVAACAMLALVFLGSSGQQPGAKAFSASSLPRATSNDRLLSSRKKEEGLFPNHAPLAQAIRPANLGAIPSSASRKSSPSTRDRKPVFRRVKPEMAPINDPRALWAQVKEDSTTAEVELARIYLEGTIVPQNCKQAEILLQVASRKGNLEAVQLLADNARRCR